MFTDAENNDKKKKQKPSALLETQPTALSENNLISGALSSTKRGQLPCSPFAGNTVEMAELMFLYKSPCLWNCIDTTETSVAG